MRQQLNQQNGLSLIELLISVMIAGILIAAMQGLIGSALNSESDIRQHNDSLQQGRFALQLMVQSVRKTRRLMIPLGENPVTAYLESERDVLAVTLDPTLDRDNDGWADANNDKDYLDVNNNGLRDAGEPERVDEDLFNDATKDGVPGIKGIDDDGDGLIDEGIYPADDDEDGQLDDDIFDGLDNDKDGSIDEDSMFDMNQDGAPGIIGIDDDLDGTVDEGFRDDDDEDGSRSEDWFDPVVYFLNGSTLVQRVPNISTADGTYYQENPIAEYVSAFKVIRIPQGGGRRVLVDISLQITPPDAETVKLQTRVAVGSGL